jgi:hypothetical protein
MRVLHRRRHSHGRPTNCFDVPCQGAAVSVSKNRRPQNKVQQAPKNMVKQCTLVARTYSPVKDTGKKKTDGENA